MTSQYAPPMRSKLITRPRIGGLNDAMMHHVVQPTPQGMDSGVSPRLSAWSSPLCDKCEIIPVSSSHRIRHARSHPAHRVPQTVSDTEGESAETKKQRRRDRNESRKRDKRKRRRKDRKRKKDKRKEKRRRKKEKTGNKSERKDHSSSDAEEVSKETIEKPVTAENTDQPPAIGEEGETNVPKFNPLSLD